MNKPFDIYMSDETEPVTTTIFTLVISPNPEDDDEYEEWKIEMTSHSDGHDEYNWYDADADCSPSLEFTREYQLTEDQCLEWVVKFLKGKWND